MELVRDSQGLIVLDRQSCLERLAMRRLAALAITDLAMPLVLPAVYALHGDDLIVSAHPSGVLGRRLPNSIVSLCVHDLNEELLSGWTVTVVGEARPIRSTAELPEVVKNRLWRSPSDADQLLVRVSTERMSGRQIPS